MIAERQIRPSNLQIFLSTLSQTNVKQAIIHGCKWTAIILFNFIILFGLGWVFRLLFVAFLENWRIR